MRLIPDSQRESFHHESFTDVINRLTEKRSILELAGLSDSESKDLSNQIKEMRNKSSKRLKVLARKMNVGNTTL